MNKLANILFWSGFFLLIAALLWWAYFYGGIAKQTGSSLTNAFSCLYSNDGACAVTVLFAKVTGNTAYNPMAFWSGAIALIVGGLMKLTSKP